jgi:hypothetical protein
MRGPIPFCESVEDHGGIDQSGNEATEKDDKKDKAKRTA